MMKKFFVYLLLATAFVIQVNGQVNWTKNPGNPIFLNGQNGTWDADWVFAPTIIVDENNKYQMWYSGYGGGNGSRTGYAKSDDGINWERYPDPVLPLGPAGSWDAATAFQPSVLYDGTTYRMWYSGHPGNYMTQIGYATSMDSIHWTRHGDPVLQPGSNGSWDDYYVDAPEVLFIDGVYHMWYAGNNGTNTQIGHATSVDGVTWEKDTLNPVLTNGAIGKWDDLRVDQPSLLYDGTLFHMWYGGGHSNLTVWDWKTGYAYSTDGRKWIKVSVDNPVMDLGSTGEWDDQYNAGGIAIIFDDNSNEFKMWYSGGRSDGTGNIGYATSVIKKKPRSQYTVEDWRKEIDEYWGEGDPTDKKLAIFDEIWNRVDDGFNSFQNLDVDWDALREKYRPEIEAGVSQGRFVGIINSMARQLQETHLWLYYKPINLAPKVEPGEPIMSISSFANNRHFGATLTPLPDSSLLVYKAFPNHPLGLVPGDIVLGYEGVPWKKLYKDLLNAELPLKLNGITGATKEACEYIYLSSAGLNWHLYDTIDIVKYESGDTLHLPTAVLAGQTGRIMGSDQVPVNGINFWADEGTEILSVDTTSDFYWTKPDINADYLTSGILDNTDIGYIYLATASDDNVPDLELELLNAFKKLDNDSVKGIIFDLRYNTGGSWGALDDVFAYIYKNGFKVTNMFTRSSTEDHLLMKPWIMLYGPDVGTSVVTVHADSTTSYNKPIALLVGPGCVSAAEFSVLKFKKYNKLRIFGKETSGALSVGNSVYRISTSANWLFGQSQANMKLYEDSSRYLSHTGLEVDEKIWLDQYSVAHGIDNVVSKAVDWINSITTGIDQFSGKNIPTEIRLFQNYPNPFNPFTKIKYQVPTTGFVSLRVYNLLGELIATLVDEEKPVGNYAIEFSAANLSSGVYFYQLQAGSFVETKKMILLK